MDQRALYERIASGQPGHRDPQEIVLRNQFVVDDIRQRLGGDHSVKIAELSIGHGGMTVSILSGLPQARLTCAEIARGSIEAVQERLAMDTELTSRSVEFIECNFDTDFGCLPDGSFDVAIALDVMEHVLDPFGFMSNCCRILRSGGMLYLRVPNIAYLKHRIGLLCGRLPVTASWFETPGELLSWRDVHGWDGGHLHLFTIPILRKLAVELGFSVEDCKDPGTRFSAFRSIWPALLFSNPLLVLRKAS